MIKLYKEISKEILRILDKDDIDDVKLIEKFKKRQELMDCLNGKELDEFRRTYNEEEIYKLDKEIKTKIAQQMMEIRKEISEFKVNKTANSTYVNMNKNNLNIFYKKV